MSSVSVAFVDDHPALVKGIESIFASSDEYNVVATGSTCGDAVAIVRAHKPDVIVLDLNMPGDIFECIAQIRSELPQTKVVAFTASSGVKHAVMALEAGASGYVLKGSSLDDLSDAINTVVRGNTFITQGFATQVISALRQPPSKDNIKLSVREEQIVGLLLEGRTNREIASEISISEKTVKYYMTLLMQKLKVRNRVGVVIAARSLYKDEYGANSVGSVGMLN